LRVGEIRQLSGGQRRPSLDQNEVQPNPQGRHATCALDGGTDAVTDIAWSTTSAAVFAAVTGDGRVALWDATATSAPIINQILTADARAWREFNQRYARLLGLAVSTMESLGAARAWLAAPQVGLGGESPLAYAETEVGAREVEDLLGRIEYGVLA
jgi:hypothetical protein